MVERPTAVWRQQIAYEVADLAAGRIDPEEAFTAGLWPEPMICETDDVLDRFDAEVADLVNHRHSPGEDAEIREVIRCTVLALNTVDVRHDGPYETGERELLCGYIEHTLDGAGLDVDGFATRQRMTRHEITDEWREW
jgi:hypothetical protein